MLTRRIAAALVAATLVTGGCGVLGDDNEPEEAVRPTCESPTVTDLGIPFGGRASYFTHSGGEVFIEVTHLPQDTVLGDITRTRIDLGPGDQPPRPDPQGSSRMENTAHTVSVELGRLSRITLPEGTYWLVSSNGGRIRLHTCDDVRVGDVRPASAEPGAAFGY
jgi:hypothetical protein